MTEEKEIDTEDKMYGKWDLILQYALPRMWFAPNQFRNTLIDDIKQLQMYMQNYDFKNFSKCANKIERSLNESRFNTILSLFIDTYEQIEEYRIIEIDDLRNRIESLEKQIAYLKSNSSETYSVTKCNQHTEEGKLIKEKTCLICNASFKSNRKDSMYCSYKCKQAAYRARKENKKN
jgi:hypothetical protein